MFFIFDIIYDFHSYNLIIIRITYVRLYKLKVESNFQFLETRKNNIVLILNWHWKKKIYMCSF